MRIEVLTVPGCPNGPLVEQRLAEAAAGRPDVTVKRRVAATAELAEEYGMRGSPTVLINGRDPFPETEAGTSLSCRLYRDERGRVQGAPSTGQLRAALAAAECCAAAAPSHESSSTYESADGTKRPVLVFEPAEGTPPAAGIVLFHGGGLRSGTPGDLAPHCRQLASRGILAVSAGYRLVGQGAASMDDCIADVRRAVTRFRGLAAAHGLGPSRLASGGSSAGAHLALAAAMITCGRAVPAPDSAVAAIVALNPVVDLLAYSADEQRHLEQEVARVAAGTLGQYSPAELIRPGNPPVLIQHGTADAIAPIATVRRFRDLMTQTGNDCVLLEYEGARHAFHYPSPAGHFDSVIDATAEFLLGRLAASGAAGRHNPCYG